MDPADPKDASATPSLPERSAPALAGGDPPTAPRGHTLEPDRVAGFSILFVAFAAALVISWKSAEAVRPNVAQPPSAPTREGLAGYPAVEPVAILPLARQLAERNQLRRIVVNGASADGRVDLSQPSAHIRYEFDSAVGEGPEAPRPKGTVRHGRYCGRRTVHVKADGIYTDPDQPTAPCRATGDPLPEPRCSLDTLWARALAKRPDANGRALIEYYRAHGGPAWRFTLLEQPFSFTLFGDCERELRGREARALAGSEK